MAEYTNNAVQTINPGESVVFTESPEPCNRGLVRHRDGTGEFLLSGWMPQRYSNCSCRCNCSSNRSVDYFADFGANIAIPEGGTVGEISVAFAVDGVTIPYTNMRVTPAAVEEYFNVSRATNIPVWRGCCQSFSIRNTSDQPILLQETNVVITRPDLSVTY